ncbi:hypothetical protein H5V45_07165 [Nocardioides sp. KIGAM211]|uniref:PknH-like extracellular domain-containing protein n=1 Tax=Nocardioides luti TaxID=2761101 RepID=A0A7X0RF20_9ACTN|nr:hypothetical protein [Nocardioides luti]MBB6627099.1 hypothetical protein [Nocardioides luti]
MRRPPLLPLLAIALTTVLATTACGADERRPVDLAGPPPSLQHRGSGAGAGSGEAATDGASPSGGTPSAPSASSTAHRSGGHGGGHRAGHRPGQRTAPPIPSRAPSPSRHLLTADALPGLGDDLIWTVTTDGPEGEDPVGACQKTPLTTIGAVGAARRDFSAADGTVTATQVVARFADPKSAWRAHEVLRAWRDDCAERLEHARVEVGPLVDVEVTAGSATAYRAAYGPRRSSKSADTGRDTGLGIVRHGSWLSVVEVTTVGGDYPPRRDPAHVALRRIARTFG